LTRTFDEAAARGRRDGMVAQLRLQGGDHFCELQRFFMQHCPQPRLTHLRASVTIQRA
jgi:hypothetical protein